MKTKIFSTFLLLIIVITGLINESYFYQVTSIAYYGFCISALIFVITSSCFYLFDNKLFTLQRPVLLFGLWVLYINIHYYLLQGNTPIVVFCTIHFIFVCSAIRLFKSTTFNFNFLAIGIIIIATLESLYCIIQHLGWLESQNNLFTVTGSWSNPNVSAMFLAMTAPLFFYSLNKQSKKTFYIGFGIVLIALYLLKCRAAFIGTLIASIVYCGLEYDFIDWAKDTKNRMSVKALFILSLILIISFVPNLYNNKKASSDGRKFIWKLSTIMVSQSPVFGIGYGRFEKEYNLFQSHYIEQGKASEEEMQNAGYVLVPHNEILQNAVEGGLIGLGLLSLFVGSLLVAVRKKKELCTISSKQSLHNNYIQNTDEQLVHIKRVFNLAYAGLTTFVVMSMFNFAILCIPVMTMFSLYTAIICSQLKPISLPRWFINRNNTVSLITKITGVTISVFLLHFLINSAIADRQNKKAFFLMETGNFKQALITLKAIEPNLKQYADYWKNKGNVYFKTKNYPAAIICFEKAKTSSSNPELFYSSGVCYYKMREYPNAIIQYRQLVLTKPSKFRYRYLLMKAYLKNKDFPNALITAQGIINLRPKIPSQKVLYYKKLARKVVREIYQSKPNNTPTKINQFNKLLQ